MPLDSKQLLQDLKRQVRTLEDDLRQRAQAEPEIRSELEAEYRKGREAGRIGEAFESWRDGVLTQAAVHWVLGCVFVRFLEDNGLIDALLSGPGGRAREAADQYAHYFQQPDHRTHNDRHYLQHAFAAVAALPAGERLFDRAHNPVWSFPISADAARELLGFWRQVDPNTGALVHEFKDETWDTRFLGDLYQDLSEAAKKTYALLQTPVFVEEFILDRALGPALREFPLPEVRMIDPTCGSGHFLLGGFERLLREWQRKEPGTLERELVQRALDGVYGVDLNPFAVAIARFRLLMAALRASSVRRLAQAPDFRLHVATGDALLFGAQNGQLPLQLGFHMEDAEAADRILSQHYHAVVGNPPYITVKDRALNQAYRQLYATCHMKYALSVPFIERFWQLALPGSSAQPAGFVGMINSNSFMKREFGKKVVEEFFPRVDLTHVIDTSGAYIPGHGTPTVILFGRNRAPVGESVRAVMGIRGEPSPPADPAQGQVWTAITQQTDVPGSESGFVSVADTAREIFGTHPWSIGGGGAAELKESIESAAVMQLGGIADVIGFASFTGTDEAFESDAAALRRAGIPDELVKGFVTGDIVRDWTIGPSNAAFAPYDERFRPIPLDVTSRWHQRVWPLRASLGGVTSFGGKDRTELGQAWWTWYRWIRERYLTPLSLTFAEVATHNHFVLDRGGKVLNRTAPVIKLPSDATESDHLALLGLLNSSTACFWLKQVAHNKGAGGGTRVEAGYSPLGTDMWESHFAFNGTRIGQFPVPPEKPVDLAARLDALAQERQQHLPNSLARQLPMPRAEWERSRTEADRLLREIIALQEELDWRCYRIYGLTGDELTYRDSGGQPLTPAEIRLGERAFEIVLAGRMVADEEETTWFARHGSTPITELPAHWPTEYRALVERRIQRIEEDRYVGLVERPEYKRRWNVEPWDEQAKHALEVWMLDRLESPAYWPEVQLQTTRALADRAGRDPEFMAVAELYQGHAGFDVHALVRQLAEADAVPFLPVLRYKPSGLRKREVWERAWELQRQEDAIDARVAAELARIGGEGDSAYQERLKKQQDRRTAAEVGDIPRPPKYTSADFQNSGFWKLRGALDVPKERFVSYPFCSKDNDPSLLLGWAGWHHLEQAQALAAWLNELTEFEGWPAERLVPVLAGLAELIPWLKQWHNEPTPEFGRLGDFFETFLDGQLNAHGLTRQDLAEWMPPVVRRGRRKKTSV
jgi:hypothetical protein